MLGPVATADFSLFEADGDKLVDVDLNRGARRADPDDFIGNLTVPSTAFRATVTGVTATGQISPRNPG